MLNVEAILEQRYPDFVTHHSTAARTLSRFLGFLFYQSRFEQFAREYPHLEGFDFVEAALRFFDFTLRLREDERKRIPATGRVVIVANHPIGSLDGLALLHLVREVRPDVKVVANDMLAVLDPLKPVLLPVNNMGGRTPRENLRNIKQHLRDDGALIIFPAGEVSRFGPKGVKDGRWQPGFIKMARSTGAPVLPIFVAGRNSLFFYSISFLARPLSTLWLVREMFKQSHNTVDARVGNPIPFDVYSRFDASSQHLAGLFRKHVYRLARGRRGIFQTTETVAAPENRLLLKRELEQCEVLGETPDGKRIYLYRQKSSDCLMREIGRLRELTFRSVGEGSGNPRDIDRFDRDYLQLVLWDPEQLEIAGAYRLGDSAQLCRDKGQDALYTSSLFHFGEGMQPVLAMGLELGRSFVQPRYQNRQSLDYLWLGIGAFLRRYPNFRYLFGPVSISRLYGNAAIARIVYYYSLYHGNDALEIEGRTPYLLSPEHQQQIVAEFSGQDRDADFRVLRDYLAEHGMPVPILYKHYAEVAEPEGVSFAAFNIDHDFGDCVDGLIVVDLDKLKPRKRKRYLGQS
ncbi:MAG: lysophospholipid acyltransferase family protein [Halieaceae bacterium]|nr:lysophospholipid acyltransferase family protein [Halieaceae bacterium]